MGIRTIKSAQKWIKSRDLMVVYQEKENDMYKLTVFRKIFSLKLGKIAVGPLVGTWIEI